MSRTTLNQSRLGNNTKSTISGMNNKILINDEGTTDNASKSHFSLENTLTHLEKLNNTNHIANSRVKVNKNYKKLNHNLSLSKNIKPPFRIDHKTVKNSEADTNKSNLKLDSSRINTGRQSYTHNNNNVSQKSIADKEKDILPKDKFDCKLGLNMFNNKSITKFSNKKSKVITARSNQKNNEMTIERKAGYSSDYNTKPYKKTNSTANIHNNKYETPKHLTKSKKNSSMNPTTSNKKGAKVQDDEKIKFMKSDYESIIKQNELYKIDNFALQKKIRDLEANLKNKEKNLNISEPIIKNIPGSGLLDALNISSTNKLRERINQRSHVHNKDVYITKEPNMYLECSETMNFNTEPTQEISITPIKPEDINTIDKHTTSPGVEVEGFVKNKNKIDAQKATFVE